MMRGPSTAILALTLACVTPAVAVTPDFGKHAILRTLRLPRDFAAGAFPQSYSTSVELSGKIADEMAETYKALGPSAPRYRESLSRGGMFTLEIVNDDYTADTRSLLSGILNPVDMIDMVIRSAVKYADDPEFETMARETEIAVSGDTGGVVTIALSPKGERFAYAYEDMGTFMEESWLTGLTLRIDPAQRTVHEMTMRKISRSFALDQRESPNSRLQTIAYRFSYRTFGGHLLPERLVLSLDSAVALTITASYRSQGDRVVFDSRSVCYAAAGGSEACLVMTYGTYSIPGQAAADAKRADKGGVKSLNDAAQMSRKAAQNLRDGKIRAAGRLLQKLVEQYPGTPHAAEARKLLLGLPDGL